jgi:hypothetical protein
MTLVASIVKTSPPACSFHRRGAVLTRRGAHHFHALHARPPRGVVGDARDRFKDLRRRRGDDNAA